MREKRKGKWKGIRRIALLTGGGDCPGLNAVIRAVTRAAILQYGWEVLGVEDGFEGLVEGHLVELNLDRVSDIIAEGGTILGTSNRVNPFQYVEKGKSAHRDASKQVLRFFREKRFDALVCVGGEGTMSFAKTFAARGLPIVGIPKTIDNDVRETERSVGFYTAVHTATEAIDKLHTTAESHHRAMVVEVMGRDAGWLALGAGMAGGADLILIPEIPFDLRRIYAKLKERFQRGRRFTIIVIGEGAHPAGGRKVFQRPPGKISRFGRLGGISHWLVARIERHTGIEARAVILGHLLRSGPPIYQDRLLATSFGFEAVRRLARGERGIMVGWLEGKHLAIPLERLPKGPRLVPRDHEWVRICESMGAGFASREKN